MKYRSPGKPKSLNSVQRQRFALHLHIHGWVPRANVGKANADLPGQLLDSHPLWYRPSEKQAYKQCLKHWKDPRRNGLEVYETLVDHAKHNETLVEELRGEQEIWGGARASSGVLDPDALRAVQNLPSHHRPRRFNDTGHDDEDSDEEQEPPPNRNQTPTRNNKMESNNNDTFGDPPEPRRGHDADDENTAEVPADMPEDTWLFIKGLFFLMTSKAAFFQRRESHVQHVACVCPYHPNQR